MARKMKDSGIEWIGEIPEGWEVLAHKYIMHKEKSICEHYNGENIISLTLNGVVKRDLENPSGKMPATFDGYQFVEPNDLLLCLFDIDVTPRCVGLVKDYGLTSPAYSRFKVHSGFCNSYYNYLLRFIDDEKVFVHLSKNLRSSLTESDFSAIKTVVPPKAEQQRIADYLDDGTFEIDVLLSKTRSSIEEYKKLKHAVITQAVTKGVRGEREMKDSGVEWIGEIPREWDLIKATRIIKSTQNGLTRRNLEKSDGQIVLKLKNITADGKIDYTYQNRIALSSKELESYALSSGDFLFVRVNGSKTLVGKCAIFSPIGESVAYNDHIIRVKLSNYCYSKFFFWYLCSSCGKAEIDLHTSTAAGQYTISGEGLRDINLVFPALSEQTEIANYLDAKCAEIDKLIAKKEQLVKELESYKKSLIYEVVTGKREV